VNREAHRSQFFCIWETIERLLNEDTTLAERLRTLFLEHGVTIASILTSLGFIVSTIVLAIQNVVGVVRRRHQHYLPAPRTGLKTTTKRPCLLDESAGWKGGLSTAWRYWRHRLVASEDCTLNKLGRRRLQRL